MDEQLRAYFAEIGRRGGSKAKKAAPTESKPLTVSEEAWQALESGAVVEVPTAVLCQILDVTEFHLGKLAKAGHVVKVAQGQFNLWASVRSYVEFLTRQTQSRRKAPQRHTLILAEAKLEETRERRDSLAMLNDEMRRQLVPVADLRKALGTVSLAMWERIRMSNLSDEEKGDLQAELGTLTKISNERGIALLQEPPAPSRFGAATVSEPLEPGVETTETILGQL